MRPIHFCLTTLLLVILGWQTAHSTSAQSQPLELRKTIQAACFEVVVKKPGADSLTYEKELPWKLVDFNIRNDMYTPLATAFAISETEVLTAAHVLELLDDSPFYKELYIRDSNGEVFPIDLLLSFHSAKDFVKFTVKNKTFKTWFTLRSDYVINEDILAVGNIYGEGLVSIPGTLLGTLAEPENGEWSYLKSSPPNDSGSSGGPLLDRNGRVLGIIVAKNDNFSYSLPISELNSSPKDIGVYHQMLTYGFNLFPEKIDATAFDYELKLPNHYSKVKQSINRKFADHYKSNMDKLFSNNQENIFPNGKSSLISLNDACDATDLQVLYKDKDDLTWYFSNIKKETSSLGQNGSVLYDNINSTYFIDIVKPDDISMKELYSSPKFAMDYILKGINLTRKVASQDIRILSLGDPMSSKTTQDAYGRKWIVSVWGIEYSNQAGIMYYSPTPDGLVCLLKFASFSQKSSWLYDLKRTLDFIYIPYIGTLEQWSEFLDQKELLYGTLKNARVRYEPTKSFSLKTDEINLELDEKTVKASNKARLSLAHDFYKHKGKTVWGVRKVVFSEENKDNYFVIYRHIKPHPDLPDNHKANWETVVQKGHPYDEVSFSENGRTNIGSIHPKYVKPSNNELQANSWIHTIYLGNEGNISKEIMASKLNTLKKDIRLN